MSFPTRLTLELFPDVVVDAVYDRFDVNATGVTWVGHLANAPLSSVTLVYGGGLLAGSIVATPDGTFQIRPASEAARRANPQPAGAMHEITQVDQPRSSGKPSRSPAVLAPDAIAAADDAVKADAGDVST